MSKTLSVQEFSGFLAGVVDRLENPKASKVLSEWNDTLAGDLAEGFLSSKSPDGESWPALKRQRPKGHNQGSRPLIDSGDLMRSVISDGPGHIEIVTDDSTTFGTNVIYAGVQHFGNKPGAKNNIPPRPFIGIPDKAVGRALDMLSGHLINVIDAI